MQENAKDPILCGIDDETLPIGPYAIPIDPTLTEGIQITQIKTILTNSKPINLLVYDLLFDYVRNPEKGARNSSVRKE